MSDFAQGMRLAIVDTTGIQAYIFGTNTLRHHMGASWLVDWATQGAVYETMREFKDNSITNLDVNNDIVVEQVIEDPAQKLDVELVYAGGGNAVLIFRTEAFAVAFTKKLTRKILKTAPGLQVVVTHIDFAWTDILASKLNALRQVVNRKKNQRHHSMPLLGLGVTADCQFIDLPAEEERWDSEGNPQRISGEC